LNEAPGFAGMGEKPPGFGNGVSILPDNEGFDLARLRRRSRVASTLPAEREAS